MKAAGFFAQPSRQPAAFMNDDEKSPLGAVTN
jgi:hypothetical protein